MLFPTALAGHDLRAGPSVHRVPCTLSLRLIAATLLLVTAFAQAADASERIALVIGNAAYDTAPLANPANDAELIAATLQQLGFTVSKAIDADQIAMKRAIQSFGDGLARAGKGAVGLFYFAGHGVQAAGRNYLIPVGARIRRETDLEIEAVPADWVLQQMDYAGNGLNLVILDACRDNPLARSFRSALQGLAPVQAPSGTLIAYATAPGQVAVDGEQGNSPYSLALARAMRLPGLPVERMFKTVRAEVQAATNDAQTPWEHSSLVGEFSFQPASDAVAATTQQADMQIEIAWWQSIGNSTNPVDYRAYLERFGQDAAFSHLAEARLATLTASPRVESDHRGSDLDAARAAVRKVEAFIADLKNDSDGLLGRAGADMPLARKLDVFRGFLGSVVDFAPMARFVLGRHGKSLDESEFAEFLRYYEALFLKTYNFTRGDVWDGGLEVEEIRPYGSDYLVTVSLQPKRGGGETVGLRIRRKDGSYFGFVIIDVLYQGVSLLVTQKADFASALRRGGVRGLIEQIEAKVGYQEEVVDIPG